MLKQKGGDYYAIDPSLVDAGVPPPVIPLKIWLSEWPPDLSRSDAPTKRVDIGTRLASAEGGKKSEARSRGTAASR